MPANPRANTRFLPPVLLLIAAVVFILAFAGKTNLARSASVNANAAQLRLGFFPNLTHAPALIGIGKGMFQAAVGRDVDIRETSFNAGPEAMEALLAGDIDIAYVGPGPAINTYVKSDGGALRIIAGACSGGASLVARRGIGINRIEDLKARRVAIPQVGGTQDISLRHFLGLHGLSPTDRGGSVEVISAHNPDILSLMKRGQIDAAWVPEPWASRIVKEASAITVVDERTLWPEHTFTTTVVVVRSAYLKEHSQQVQRFLRAHREVVDWMNAHTAEARAAANGELKQLTGKALDPAVLTDAWSHLTFSVAPDRGGIEAVANAAKQAGYLPDKPLMISSLIDELPIRAAANIAAHVARP